jgi:hypothetical protein
MNRSLPCIHEVSRSNLSSSVRFAEVFPGHRYGNVASLCSIVKWGKLVCKSTSSCHRPYVSEQLWDCVYFCLRTTRPIQGCSAETHARTYIFVYMIAHVRFRNVRVTWSSVTNLCENTPHIFHLNLQYSRKEILLLIICTPQNTLLLTERDRRYKILIYDINQWLFKTFALF